MNSKLQKNAVLSGCMDYFCLVCEYHLWSEAAAQEHVDLLVHQKNLGSFPYLQKFYGECIRKIKKGYLCEFCNLLLPTAAKVNLHVTEDTHVHNKGIQLLKRIGNNIVIGNEILIPEYTWNGLIDDTCAVCNAEFHNIKLHVTDQKHVLNLIQKKVNFGIGNIVYRKVDDISFHCLICNLIFALSIVKIHYKDEVHQANTKKCREFFQANLDNANNQSKALEKDLKINEAKVQKENEKVNNFNNDKSANVEIKSELKNINTHNKEIEQNGIKPTPKKQKNDKKTKEPSLDIPNSSSKYMKLAPEKVATTEMSTCDSKNSDKTEILNKSTEKGGNESKDIKKAASKRTPKSKKSDKHNDLATSDKKCENTNAEAVKIQILTKTEAKETCTKQDNETIADQNKKLQMGKIVTGKPEDTTNLVKQKTYKKVDKDELINCLAEFQKNGVDFNFETETAFCKKCFVNVDMHIDTIKQHIEQHKNNPQKSGANVLHTVDKKNSKTVLNSKENDENPSYRTEINEKYKLDLNHNETNQTNHNENEEIIKIDLTKKHTDSIIDNDSDSVIPYVPGTAKSPSRPSEKAREPENIKTTHENIKTTPENIDNNDPATFAKANKLTFNKDNRNAFCRICKLKVPASIKNMKEHVSGASHKKKAAAVAATENVIPKRTMEKFIKHVSTVTNIFGIDDVILNDKFCLTRMSFYMITEQNKLRCQACEVNLKENEVSRHVNSIFHERAMKNTLVVWSLDTEFVREVRPGLFHCGYCNLIVGVWEDVAKHLKCSDHLDSKSEAESRRDKHMPSILAHRAEKEDIFMRALFQHFGCFF